jgi:hypothetical protein
MVPTLAFLALTVTSVFLLRRTSQNGELLTTPGFPISPLLFVVPTVALVILLILRDPLRAAVGTAIVAAGVPISGWVVAHRRKTEHAEFSQPASGCAASPPNSIDRRSASAPSISP